MRILICDDERSVREQLKTDLEEYFMQSSYDMPEFAAFSNGDTLLADSGRKDMVFLDIEMPGSNGIQISEKLKKKYPHVFIFITTSHMQYLDDAMNFQVFRYLSKPLEKERLFHSMDQAICNYYRLVSTIVIETENTSTTVPESDIIYIEAQERNTFIHTVSEVYSTKQPLRFWLDTLNTAVFFQTHKSYLVNMAYVTEFSHEQIAFSQCHDQAYLSRRKYKPFKKAYYLYLGYNR